MKYQVFVNSKPIDGALYSTAMECAAFILTRGWIDTVERHGMVWAKGVEVRPIANGVSSAAR